ncbi:cupin domain-containing protein [Desulfospira joergensenii]|uniref:cupin domain-containing protein n=1 Tax=Desulfospira joergensenii TaxID=53329 RepID=UPI0003B6FF5E|nr:cupin domain-containing protein [Desulfospira joergensenii]
MTDQKKDPKKKLIKNIDFSRAIVIRDLVDYEEGRVVSRTLASHAHVNITLFAFEKGEEISAHTSPGDAMILVLDGEARVNIDGNELGVKAGQTVVMPANVPHSVSASTRFKMLLTVVKQPVGIGGL